MLIRPFLALAAGVLVLVSPACAATDGAFPDDYFFPNRPQSLKDIEGKSAPDLSLEQWIGEETSLQATRGKVVVVDFWATWCGPCMASIPHNVELVNKFKDKGLVFIGVHDAQSGWEKAAGVVNDKNINYPVAHDKSGGPSAKAFAVAFWLTYVAIDHRGIVRAAGLRPDHVDDVVTALIAEMPVVSDAGAGGNPVEWYLGGGQRPAWLRQAEGKKDVKLEGNEWLGKTLSDDDRKGRVVVLHFVSPTSEIGMRQLLELAKLDAELGPQGLSIVGVCDARAEWNQAKMIFEQRGIKVPVVHDNSTGAANAVAAAPDAAAPEAPAAAAPEPKAEAEEPVDPKASPLGRTATGLGIRLAPTTIVIDKNGVVRAAGVKPDKVKEIVNKLLAEPASST